VITAAAVGSTPFTKTRFREGYDMRDVDRFLTTARRNLLFYEGSTSEQPSLSAADVVGVRFLPTRYRGGYDQDQVDTLLDQIVETLQGYEARGRTTIL
jgi:DivIVA domain-containing protein